MQSTQLSSMKGYMSFAFVITQIASFSILSSWYDGQVLAKLPFTPIFPFSSIFRRGLDSPDLTEVSFLFFLIVTNTFFRPVLQKLLGFDMPRGVQAKGSFQQALDQARERSEAMNSGSGL